MTVSNKSKNITGIVVESYYHDKVHSIVVVRARHDKSHFFFYVKRDPEVALGDVCQMNFPKDEIFIIRDTIGQKFKKFKLNPVIWPGTLLLEIMSERFDI